MKYLISVMVLLGLAACSSDTEEMAEAPVAEKAEMPAEMPAVADEPPMTIAMVEFVWHKKGPDFSEEALLAHTEKWAGIVDEAGWNLRSAAVITPRFDNPNAEFMWAMAWPSLEARNTAWSEWAESYEADWLASSEGVFTYDSETVPTFKPNRGRVSSMPTPVGGTGVREYIFCSYNEGFGADDMAAYRLAFNAYVDGVAAEAGPSSYWWAYLSPMFDPQPENPFDFMWTNSWATDAERDAGQAAFVETELAAEAQTMLTCSDPFVFDTRRIYAGA